MDGGKVNARSFIPLTNVLKFSLNKFNCPSMHGQVSPSQQPQVSPQPQANSQPATPNLQASQPKDTKQPAAQATQTTQGTQATQATQAAQTPQTPNNSSVQTPPPGGTTGPGVPAKTPSASDGPKQSFWSNKTNRYLVYAFAVVFVVLGGVAAAIYFYESPKEDEATVFTEKETMEILSKVVDNNPKGVVNGYDAQEATNANAALGLSGNYGELSKDDVIAVPVDSASPTTNAPIPAPTVPEVGDVKPAEEQIIVPDLDVYNYRRTVTVFEPGPAYEKCFGTDWEAEERTDEYWEYFDVTRTYYKMKSTVGNNEFSSYHLGKYGVDVNDYYAYRGGDFAALVKQEPNPSFSNEWRMEPASYPGQGLTVEERVKMYFGANARITDVYDQDGVTYYEITVVYPWGCTMYSRTLIWIYTVNSETFEVVRRRGFVDNLQSMSNLVSDMSVSVDRGKVTLDSVSEMFEFDYDVDIRDVDFAGYEYDEATEYTRFIDYFNLNGYSLIAPKLSDFDLVYLSGKNLPERVPNERYYLDRSYYKGTDEGLAEYESVIERRADRPYVSTGFFNSEDPYGWINVNLYGSNESVDGLLDRMFQWQTPSSVTRTSAHLYLDYRSKYGEKGYSSNEAWFTQPVSYPTSFPTEYPETIPTSYGTYYAYRMYSTSIGVRQYGTPYVLVNYGSSHWYIENQQYLYVDMSAIDYGEMSEAIRGYLEACNGWWMGY